MATIGKSRAVGQIGRVKLTGRIAWFAWLLIHVYQLIGFRNRLAVIFNWAWNYMFSKRGAQADHRKGMETQKLELLSLTAETQTTQGSDFLRSTYLLAS